MANYYWIYDSPTDGFSGFFPFGGIVYLYINGVQVFWGDEPAFIENGFYAEEGDEIQYVFKTNLYSAYCPEVWLGKDEFIVKKLSSGYPRRELPAFTEYLTISFVIGAEDEPESEQIKRDVKCDPCASLAAGLATGSAALQAAGVSLGYSSDSAGVGPASMGWGWTMVGAHSSVYEDTSNDDMVQRIDGYEERWKKLPDDSYAPRWANNYSALEVKVSGDVVITQKNKVELTYRALDGKLVTEVDRNGNTISYDYDEVTGDLVSITDGEGRGTFFEYGMRTDGQPTEILSQDPTSGRVTSLEYHLDGRLKKVTDPEGEAWEYVYDGNGLLYQEKDPRGEVAKEYLYASGRKQSEITYGLVKHSYVYSTGPNGEQVTTVTEEDLTLLPSDPNPRVTVYTYNAFSKLIKLVDPLENEFSFEYLDSRNPYLMTLQRDPNGHETRFGYDEFGNRSWAQDAQGNTTFFDYTEGYLLSSVLPPPVTVHGGEPPTQYPPTTFSYVNGNLETITETIDSVEVTRSYVVNSSGRVTHYTDARGNVTEFTYTSYSPGVSNAGNLETVVPPSGPGTDPEMLTTLTYDLYDNVLSVTDAMGNTVEYQYDDKDRTRKIFYDQVGGMTEFHYADGLLSWVELPSLQDSLTGSSLNRRRTTYVPDDAGRVVEVVSAKSTTTDESRVRYGFDGRSNLKSLTRLRDSLDMVHSFSYDALNRLVQAKDPLLRETGLDHSPYCSTYTVTSPRGIETTYSRDSLCRLTEIETPEEIRNFEYDEWGRLVKATQTPNPQGKYDEGQYHIARYGKARSTQYVYDQRSRLTKITFPNEQTLLYEYDDENNLTRTTDVFDRVTRYEYRNDNRLSKVISSGQEFVYHYDAAGRPSRIVYPEDTGIIAKFADGSNNPGWNSKGQLTHLRYVKGSSRVYYFEYGYDLSGNRISAIETPATGSPTTWAYAYDWLNRLTAVSKNGSLQSTYTYDESDNRKSLALPAKTITYDYDDANQLEFSYVDAVLEESFDFDADGNMVSRTKGASTTSYQWDSFNKLKSIQGPSFSERYWYDHEGIRKEDGSGKKFYSSGSMSVADRTPEASVSYIQGPQLLGMRMSGSFYWYITDGLGSVRAVVDSTGTSQVANFSSDEFGNTLSATGSQAMLQHTYTGGLGVRSDPGGLLYMRQRYYDPGLGRWLSADPIGFRGGLNLYTYVGNNPVNRVDPNGLAPIWPPATTTNPMAAPPVPNAMRQALQIVHEANPNWTTRASTWNSGDGWWDAREAEAGGSVAGATRYAGTSYIHTQRLSRLEDPTFRFFKYLETVSHELFHQNNDTSEEEALNYGRAFLESWVRCKGTEQQKKKYEQYEQNYLDIESKWGDDWTWRHEHGIFNWP